MCRNVNKELQRERRGKVCARVDVAASGGAGLDVCDGWMDGWMDRRDKTDQTLLQCGSAWESLADSPRGGGMEDDIHLAQHGREHISRASAQEDVRRVLCTMTGRHGSKWQSRAAASARCC
jgi:hypothetical protein